MARINFGGVEETVVTREEFPISKAHEVLKDEVIAIIGYGVQGPAQSLNMRDNGFKVIIGQAPEFKSDWDKAVKDGWVPGKTLFSIEEAAEKGTVIQYLVSDAAQRAIWPKLKPYLTKGKALYFSHGFSITYKDHTGVIPPADIDVILVAPKGSGTSVRRNFLSGSGINSSFAVFQNATGRAEERTIALGIAIGSGYLFPTTFENEVFSDLTGERGVLMGALAGIMDAQYNVLRENGHSPSEAFNETVEELTQSLIRLVDENGWTGCTPTARLPHSEVHWTGDQSFAMQYCPCLRICTPVLKMAANVSAFLIQQVEPTTKNCWKKSLRNYVKAKYGLPEPRFVNYGQKHRIER
jgi:ketol-acid reductoisomerase